MTDTTAPCRSSAIADASVEILDAGDALLTSLGTLLDGGCGPLVEARALGTINRWREASTRFLAVIDRELEDPA
jgi:hypothetical protein